MAYKNKTNAECPDLMESIRWHIERYDSLRASTSSRAAIVLSADALLLAGATFLIDKFLSKSSQPLEQVLLVLSIGVTILLVAFSIVFSINAIIPPWKTSRQMYGSDIPKRLFFQGRDTVEEFKRFEQFVKRFKATSQSQMINYALGELWTGIKHHFYRYQSLRKAVQLLLGSILMFVFSILIMLVRSLIF